MKNLIFTFTFFFLSSLLLGQVGISLLHVRPTILEHSSNRLLADDEYHTVLDEANPLHYLLYFGENKYTEMSLIRIATGEMIYTKHFPQEYLKIGKKEMKVIFAFFKYG